MTHALAGLAVSGSTFDGMLARLNRPLAGTASCGSSAYGLLSIDGVTGLRGVAFCGSTAALGFPSAASPAGVGGIDGAVPGADNLKILLTLYQLAAPRDRRELVITEQQIGQIALNEPIILDKISRSAVRYMAPLALDLKLLNGDATTIIKDAIVTVRFRRQGTDTGSGIKQRTDPLGGFLGGM